jgi:hypothetical protein
MGIIPFQKPSHHQDFRFFASHDTSRAVTKFVSSGFFTEFSCIFFHSSFANGNTPFVFYHPLELVDPCFEDSDEGSLSDFAENVRDHTFYALSVRDVVFGEFRLI